MPLETYYTIRSIQSACGTGTPTLFDLIYRRVWRPELGDEGQWCDFLVEQKGTVELQIPVLVTT
jgi:hypothetical protein